MNQLLIAIVLLILSSGCKPLGGAKTISKESVSSKPNIILIMNDDMGYECLGSNGSTSYSTPHLDMLAKNGMRFTNCYSQPLCTPSRVKIMTGKYNSNNYVDFGYLDPSQKTFGNILKEAGYKTMIAGKWQLNGVETQEKGCMDLNRPHHFGFDEYCLWWLASKGSRYAKPKIVRNGKMLETTVDDYGPDIISDYIIDFLERNQTETFFVYYPMLLVHAPFQPTPDSPEWESQETRKEKDPRYFKDMVEYTDKIIGKITGKLKELGLAENTILIFTGDNGTNSDIVTQTINGSYPGGKGNLKDNGTHVPLIINWPAKEVNNSVNSQLVEFSDFLPTFCDAANVELPGDIDGKSFFKLMTGEKYSERETVFVHYYPNPRKVSERAGCFVRTANYKLYSTGQFFDMKADKWEKHPLNLSELNPGQQTIYKQLKEELDKNPVWDFTVPHRVL